MLAVVAGTLAVTAWLAEDDLEPARRGVESLLPSGPGERPRQES